MTRIGDKYDIQIDPDGKVRLVENQSRKYAKLDVSTRIAAKAKAKKPKLATRAKANSAKAGI